MSAVRDYATYSTRQEDVQQRFRKLRNGCQSACCYDIRLSPTTVSMVIRGVLLHEDNLQRIEAWLDENERTWAIKREVAS